MKLFDLHTDTATRLYFEDLSFSAPSLSGGGSYLSCFSEIRRVFAVFSRPSLSDDEAYHAFFLIRKRLFAELATSSAAHLFPVLAVEDARLLAGHRERLSALYKAGVRILTLLWSGATCIGGAWDTDRGLTPFGKAVLSDCLSFGILPDVSHASDPAFLEIAAIADGHLPLLATHSNSRAVYRHARNLTDSQFAVIRDSGGLVGLSLCPAHLTDAPNATTKDLLRHLDHYLSLGGEDTVALGTDFDGIETTPVDLAHTDDLYTLANAMTQLGYPESLIRKLFYKNAEDLFGKYMKRQEAP